MRNIRNSLSHAFYHRPGNSRRLFHSPPPPPSSTLEGPYTHYPAPRKTLKNLYSLLGHEMIHLGLIRAGLYATLLVFTFILFVLCCVRINDTLEVNFYDPVVAELLFTSIVTMLWCALMLCIFFVTTLKFEFLRLYWQELIGLVILWFFWIGGAAAASSIFGDLSACQQFRACQILSALLAFAWLGWITLTVMLIISIVVMITATRDGRKVLDEPLPSRGDR